jgi:hypothetical protein
MLKGLSYEIDFENVVVSFYKQPVRGCIDFV